MDPQCRKLTDTAIDSENAWREKNKATGNWTNSAQNVANGNRIGMEKQCRLNIRP